MGETSYIINCCGIVTGWEAFFDNVAGTRTVYFQIWRPVSGDTYELVGENDFSVSKKLVYVTPLESYFIPV